MFIRSGYSAQTRSWGSATEHHHHAADMIEGRVDHGPADRLQPSGSRLALKSGRTEAIEPDPVDLDGQAAGGSNDFTVALEHIPIVLGPHRGRSARVDHAVGLAHVG